MIEEVNKIIYNMLISGRGVLLPDVGTLYIERQAARKISDDRLLSPRNVVVFSSHEEAPSLIDEIVAIAGCQQAQAQDIYERWIAKTRDESCVKIGGVGELRGKSFVMDKTFGSAINPKGVKTLVIRRKSNTWIYVISALCAVLAIGVFAYLQWGDSLIGGADAKSEQVEAVAVEATPAEAVESTTDVTTPTPEASQTAASTPSVAGDGGAYAYYVVMGVFSTEANAARAVEQVRSKINDAACRVLPFGNKYMVTIFGSDKRGDCNTYIASYKDIYPDLWVYNKK